MGKPLKGARIAQILKFDLKLIQFDSFKTLGFNSQLAQFNQRNAALEICVRVCLQMPGHNRRRAEAIQDAFYHLRLAVITSNMSIKIAYAM